MNSLLILSDELSKNKDTNLTPKQVEFAKTIHASGNDLLALINDILDLSKIESGTVIVDVGEVSMRDLQDYVERTFRHVAEAKKLDFDVERPSNVRAPFKPTPSVCNKCSRTCSPTPSSSPRKAKSRSPSGTVASGWSMDNEVLNRARSVLAFSVTDTGIGIPPDKQQIIFEAFQQADGSTSRKYGGTGLGLAISREIARLLGGEIQLSSAPGEGSTFTLYLPQHYIPVKPVAPSRLRLPLVPDVLVMPGDLGLPSVESAEPRACARTAIGG